MSSREPYFEIYEMKPVKEVEPGWWKLRWKPIRLGTWHFYAFTWEKSLGILAYWGGAHNGWHRSYDRFDLRIGLGFRTYNFWIKWNYIVHKDGPSDVATPRPLTLAI